MEILIIFYIVFAVIIALFSVAVLIYDIATEIRQRKACTGEIADGAGTRQDSSECKEEGEEQSSTKQSLEFDAPYALRQTGTKTEVPLDTPADATFGTPNEADGEKQQYIIFSQPAAMTLEEKYAALGERERVFLTRSQAMRRRCRTAANSGARATRNTSSAGTASSGCS